MSVTEEDTTDGVPDAFKTEFKSRWKVYTVWGLAWAILGGVAINTFLLFYPQNFWGYEGLSTWMNRQCEPQCRSIKEEKDQLERNLTTQINLLNVEVQKWKCKAGSCD